jgi:5-methyltetrahydrofolate--homocysteine methyltransferase
MDLLRLLAEGRLVVGDGAMGSQLIARGLPVETPGVLWNIEKPEVVEAVQREYVAAGAQYLLTNTFGGNAVALGRNGLAGRLEEINAAAVRIARRAAGRKAAVLGDMGPTGELLQPLGTLAEADARKAFAAQASALAAAGADGIFAETFDSTAELRVALSAAREACDLPLVASMMFKPEKSGRYRTTMGEGPEKLAELAQELGCAVVGANCGQGIATMAGLVRQLAEMTDLPIVAQPNAGQPELVAGRTVYRQEASVFARHVPELFEAGAKIIGGCCGTTADHIRAIRRFADSLRGRQTPS